ncbi:carbohydrate ABC transporter permease [Clostridium beijerinckii]|uniref:carbohydrate ABC transporter permease n=1 Tax=Clostridium beijerinckii TaxID=1520 RepID=UPI001494AE5B|nr:sugar ABC transporter permease [Clostridium beijerinckii]NOW06683.1 arabinogalactan oligomer/maltooligosaccharide transport system permease protein [Clostridium beijerinckii]NYC00173.1 arabinogalactan oligomer/maltooligosaccharide transport system permease protein [Clostridium beijerinckii]
MENLNGRNKIIPYAYTSPLMISIFLLSFIPVVYTIIISFTNYNLDHLVEYDFVGLSNYKEILLGPLKSVFLPVFIWTLVFATVSALGTYIIGLIFALFLSNENMRERNIYKALLIAPWAIPGTISMLAWTGLLNQDYGGLNILLTKLHLINNNIPWLTEAVWARVAVLMVNLWLGFPWMMNVCIGAIAAVDKTYYEAAKIDGAGRVQRFKDITLPSIVSSSLPLIISGFAFNFNNFMISYLITSGGPPRLDTPYVGSTDLLGGAAYKLTMETYKYNYSATLSVLIFFIVGTLSFIQMKKTRAFEEVE